MPTSTKVGPGLTIHHSYGIVIHANSVLGRDVTVRHGVTLGNAHRGETLAPIIGDGVEIGAGAVLLGGVRIGSNAVIGANSTVLCDVPSGGIAVGQKARIVAPRP